MNNENFTEKQQPPQPNTHVTTRQGTKHDGEAILWLSQEEEGRGDERKTIGKQSAEHLKPET